MIVMMAHSVLATASEIGGIYSGHLSRARSPDRRHGYAVDADGARLVPATLQIDDCQQL